MVFLSFLLSSSVCLAGWYSGKISEVDVAFDGRTITLKVEGWSRDNCTCYSSWPSSMCLDANRDAHDFEKAMLLSALARGKSMSFYINEQTCFVTAMYEKS